MIARFNELTSTMSPPARSGMTKACLVDRLKQHLATVNGHITATDPEKIYDNRKYYNQAHNLLTMGACRHRPF
jgi:hypothetical protein